MARYIDCENCYHGKVCAERHIYHDMIVSCPHHIPTADVVEVKHGEWIEKFKEGFWYYDCPFCDDGYVLMERDENKPNYCGNCGAKMDGGKADNE